MEQKQQASHRINYMLRSVVWILGWTLELVPDRGPKPWN